LFANTTEKGLYSNSGYRTGYVVRLVSNATYFYGDSNTWLEFAGGELRFRANNIISAYTTSGAAQALRVKAIGCGDSYSALDVTNFKLYVNGNASITGYLDCGYCIELRGTHAYIDFHCGNSSADYTARLINWNGGGGDITAYNRVVNASSRIIK
jgi:hypothetical protein